jgi:hypothetical protein
MNHSRSTQWIARGLVHVNVSVAHSSVTTVSKPIASSEHTARKWRVIRSNSLLQSYGRSARLQRGLSQPAARGATGKGCTASTRGWLLPRLAAKRRCATGRVARHGMVVVGGVPAMVLRGEVVGPLERVDRRVRLQAHRPLCDVTAQYCEYCASNTARRSVVAGGCSLRLTANG